MRHADRGVGQPGVELWSHALIVDYPVVLSRFPSRIADLPLGLLAPVLPMAARGLGVPRTIAQPAGAALTFDDGPHPEGTPAVLEILDREETEAVFFLVGEQVERRPELARRIAEAGHLVGVHAHRHRLQLQMTPAEVEEDLRRAAAAISDAVGAPPRWHRPPYGIYSPSGLRAVREARMTPLLWSRWGKDWRKFTTPARIAARATRSIADGDVILLHDADFYSAHDSHRRTARALPVIIAELRRRGVATVLPA
jgi:peptidoglycan-N-acetylglucosamine deacetylase